MQTDYVRQAAEKEIREGRVAGISVLALQKGEELYRGCFGMADKENGIPVKRDTLFRMFSMTKPVTAAAAYILIERGLMTREEPVSMYLEGFRNQKVLTPEGLVPVKRECTIADLLNMTSGLVYPDGGFAAGREMGGLFYEVTQNNAAGKRIGTVEFVNRIAKMPLEFHPGEGWRYGTSADALGAVIEVVSGKRLGSFFREEIFEPLGMKDTGFTVTDEQRARLAVNYDWDSVHNTLTPYTEAFLALCDYEETTAFESGGAGLVATIDDYARFAMMLANGGTLGNVRLLGRKTVEYMTKGQLTERQLAAISPDIRKSLIQTGYTYGNLMRILEEPVAAGMMTTKGEFGWDGWTGNYFSVDPAEGYVFLYFIQRCNAGTTEAARRLKTMCSAMIR